MSEWITDRLPTRNDVNPIYDLVWVAWEDGEVTTRHWYQVQKNQPWQPFQVPAPYVKPKRWTVEWGDKQGGATNGWNLLDSTVRCSIYAVLYGLAKDQADAAQRIADAFNEVMP